MENLQNKIPFKIKYFLFFINIFSNQPFLNLLSNYKEIEEILELLDYKQITKFLYFNRNEIEQILYKEEKIIEIKSNENNDIAFYFYLYLIIKNNNSLVNYYYSFELIDEINKINYNNIFIKIIIYKIIIELINNYKNNDDYDNSEDEKLNNIIENNNKIINENINDIKQLGLKWTLKDINFKNLEEIYIEIIIALIQSKNFGDNNFTYDMLNKLEIEKINLTETMKKHIFNLLDNNDDYKISQFNDIFNNSKLTFLFILFKYILKEQILLFQNAFLMNIRTFILNTIKRDKNFFENYEKSEDNIKNKLKYILEFILEYDYYYKLKDKNFLNNNQKEIKINIIKSDNNKFSINSRISMTANKNMSNPLTRKTVEKAHKESHKEIENIVIENTINKQDLEDILFNSSFKLQASKKNNQNIIEYKEILAGKKEYKKILEIKELTLDRTELDNKVFYSYMGFINFLCNFENTIIDEYKRDENLEIILLFQKPIPEESINQDNQKELLDINCLYQGNLSGREFEFKDNNILNIKIYDGLNMFLSEVNNEEEQNNI